MTKWPKLLPDEQWTFLGSRNNKPYRLVKHLFNLFDYIFNCLYHNVLDYTLLFMFSLTKHTKIWFGTELENYNAKWWSFLSPLSKIFNTKDPKALAIIDKIPTFVSKEKKRERIFGRDLKKEVKINNHKFILKHYDQVTDEKRVSINPNNVHFRWRIVTRVIRLFGG